MASTTQTAGTNNSIFSGIGKQQTPVTVAPNFKLTPSTMMIGQAGFPSQSAGIPAANPGTIGNAVSSFLGTDQQRGYAPAQGKPQAIGFGNLSGLSTPQTSQIAPQTLPITAGGQQPTYQSQLDTIKQKALAIQQQLQTNPQDKQSPDLSGVGTSSNMSANEPNSFSDVLNSVAQNQNAYMQAGQQNQNEINAEQAVLQAMQNSQNLQTNVTAGELNQFGVGRPVGLDTGRAAQIGFNNQIGIQNAQNAQALAQQNLGLQQTNRQVRTQVAQTALQSSLSAAGLLKPEALSPGSSFVDPATGKPVAQGSGFTASSPSDLVNSAISIMNQGGAPDFTTALQIASQLYSAVGGNQQATTIEQANPSTSMSTNNFLGYNLSTYATDPNYANKLTPIVQNISSEVQSYGPQGLQSYVASVAPNAPITGAMIAATSTKYGVDPRVLTGMLQLESNFGTKGAGAKTMNPGNVGNTDSGATQHFPSWQAGLDAMGNELAIRKQQTQQAPQLPPQVAPAFNQMSDGTPYLSQDKIPSQFTAYANQFSTHNNIPILTTEQVGKVQAIDNTKQAISTIQGIIPDILGSGVAGHLLTGEIGNRLQNFFQSNTEISSFNSYRTTALNSIQALAGGSGSGLRLTQAEIDQATSNLPTITDNIETAQAKINILNGYLNKWENTILPNQQSDPNPQSSSNQDPLNLFQ